MITKAQINTEKMKLNTPVKNETGTSIFFSLALAPTNSEQTLLFTRDCWLN